MYFSKMRVFTSQTLKLETLKLWLRFFSSQIALDVQRNTTFISESERAKTKFDGRNRKDNEHICLFFLGRNFSERYSARSRIFPTLIL